MASTSGILTSQTRLPEVDGLRGLAVLLVIIFHFFIYDLRYGTPALYYSLWIFQIGWSGVDLFFVLSGFLIGGILLDYRESPNLLKTFYIRRACRILPLYIATLIIYAVGVTLLDNKVRTNLLTPFLSHGPIWPFATFTQNYWMAVNLNWGAQFNNVTWSLAIEEHFYLIFPFVVLFIPKRILPWFLFMTIAATMVCRWATYSEENNTKIYLMTHTRLDGLCMGVLVAWFLRQPDFWDRIRKWRMPLYSAGIVLAGAVCWIVSTDARIASDLMSIYGYTVLTVFYSTLLLIAITFNDSFLSAILRLGFFKFIGRLSFCLYLIHQPVKVLAYTYIRNKLPAIESEADFIAPVFAFAVSVFMAWASAKIFEGPFIGLGHRFKYDTIEKAA